MTVRSPNVFPFRSSGLDIANLLAYFSRKGDQIRIRLPKLDELTARWWQVRPILKRATDRTNGAYLPEDVLRDALNLRVGIWFVEDESEDLIAIAVACPDQMPQVRWLKITFVAGRRLAEWWPLFVSEMEIVKEKAGCSRIYAYARPGWVRFWKARGVAVHVASECIIR